METNVRCKKGGNIEKLVSRLVIEAVRTEGVRRGIDVVLGDLLNCWSGESRWKKMVSKRVGKIVAKILSGISKKCDKEPGISEDPEFISALAAEGVPLLADGIRSALATIGEGLRKLPPEERGKIMASITKGIEAKKMGSYFNAQVARLGEISREKPECASEALEKPFNNIIESVDFGQLKETLDNSEEAMVLLSRMMNEKMWRYPAKAVCLIGCLPALVNGGTRAVHETVKPFNNLAPELLADVVFSLLRMLNGKEIGLLANSVMEMVRKLHTGSYLLGEAGLPQFYADLKPLLKEMAGTIDPELLCKMKIALAEDGETIIKTYIEAVSQNPDLYGALVSSYASRKNPGIRSARMKLSLYEEFPEEDVAVAFSSGMADLDTQEIGELVNSVLRYINIVYEHRPEVIPRVLSEISAAVDAEELNRAAENVMGSIVSAVKPVAGSVMPPLVRGLAQLLTPDPSEDSSGLEEALSSLRKIIVQEGSAN
ncbi:MAG: hypothetical protein ACOY31_00045 [Bacillota bacterium]